MTLEAPKHTQPAACCWGYITPKRVGVAAMIGGGIIAAFGVVLFASYLAPAASNFHRCFYTMASKMGTNVPTLVAIFTPAGLAFAFIGIVAIAKRKESPPATPAENNT